MSSPMYPNIPPSAPPAPGMEPSKAAMMAAMSEAPPAYPGSDIPSIVVQPPTTVTTTTVVVPELPCEPIRMKCFYCQEEITTRVTRKSSFLTWLLCGGLCLFGCCLGCCLIPFCTAGTRDALHFCPKCKKYLGSYERMRIRR